jgi:hypothetical protein
VSACLYLGFGGGELGVFGGESWVCVCVWGGGQAGYDTGMSHAAGSVSFGFQLHGHQQSLST